MPTFENLYASLGGTLPLPTRMLMGASNVLRRFFLVVVLLVAALVFLFRRWKATDRGRYQWDRFKLKVRCSARCSTRAPCRGSPAPCPP